MSGYVYVSLGYGFYLCFYVFMILLLSGTDSAVFYLIVFFFLYIMYLNRRTVISNETITTVKVKLLLRGMSE